MSRGPTICSRSGACLVRYAPYTSSETSSNRRMLSLRRRKEGSPDAASWGGTYLSTKSPTNSSVSSRRYPNASALSGIPPSISFRKEILTSFLLNHQPPSTSPCILKAGSIRTEISLWLSQGACILGVKAWVSTVILLLTELQYHILFPVGLPHLLMTMASGKRMKGRATRPVPGNSETELLSLRGYFANSFDGP